MSDDPFVEANVTLGKAGNGGFINSGSISNEEEEATVFGGAGIGKIERLEKSGFSAIRNTSSNCAETSAKEYLRYNSDVPIDLAALQLPLFATSSAGELRL